ncbi:hypothetical protein BVG79_01056 [Ketogulonicigenium robustum]|uniref:Uncharacterized protein n=1 Tax=Ketogulonicigenium robustum TaxID=92947 RepID=A0A1W6NYT3_9RHOB|nr:hypothetical protein [Ketogulonicigenium robustum]ARO14402.1 hypothetical protein BVG79_01056 [Ketogulonicigenium robustum]
MNRYTDPHTAREIEQAEPDHGPRFIKIAASDLRVIEGTAEILGMTPEELCAGIIRTYAREIEARKDGDVAEKPKSKAWAFIGNAATFLAIFGTAFVVFDTWMQSRAAADFMYRLLEIVE